jgi:hypothetical protein
MLLLGDAMQIKGGGSMRAKADGGCDVGLERSEMESIRLAWLT